MQMSRFDDGIFLSEEVADAAAEGRPILALESTIFTHGLPRPRNLAVALEADDALRSMGVAPATVAVVDGRVKIGLSAGEIERLSTEDVRKLSTRDLPVAVAQRACGGTTVAAVAYLAARAGIRVMATGGVGGVHRGASTSFDESADLSALAAAPVGIVSAGVKSILDIRATLERLETLGVTVLGYRTDSYPGFYVADSGHPVAQRVESPEDVVEVLLARDRLGLPGAVQIANPLPPAQQLDPALHDRTVDEAFAAALARGIEGQDATPFLLDYIATATEGLSLEANLAVYRNNVDLGARIAIAYANANATS